MTAQLCLEAIKNSGSVFQCVPEALKTDELCLEAAKNESGEAEMEVVLADTNGELGLEELEDLLLTPRGA